MKMIFQIINVEIMMPVIIFFNFLKIKKILNLKNIYIQNVNIKNFIV